MVPASPQTMLSESSGSGKAVPWEADQSLHVTERDFGIPTETLKRLQSCRLFCSQVSETASMHSPPVTSTEINLHRLLQTALWEIEQQLLGLEQDIIRKPAASHKPEM